MCDINWILSRDEQFRYQLLGRMKMDCDYYLGAGQQCGNHLWAVSETEQIEYMKAIWNSFPADGKPEWLTFEQILDYETKMGTLITEKQNGVG